MSVRMQLLLCHYKTVSRKVEVIDIGKPYPESLGFRSDILL